jgi:hypothetical protein
MSNKHVGVLLGLLLFGASQICAAEWLQPTKPGDQPKWGLVGGLQFAIPPGGFPDAPGGPRGLIRLGYPILKDGGYRLINFIAVEPVVKRAKGFSELEHSNLDNVQGKRLWTDDTDGKPKPGKVTKLADGVEQLEVTLHVEKFDNGAQVDVTITQRSDRPDEIELTIHAAKESAQLDYCILTATMGNFARARRLWLKDEVASSLELYRDYTDRHFAPHKFYGLNKLHRTTDGDVLVAITTDEKHPVDVQPFPGRSLWHYNGTPVTQYWKKPSGSFRDDLHAAVNGRYTYWQSRRPIPGGVAFENFELREKFYEGQRFVFGMTTKTPQELGIMSENKTTK